MITYLCKYTPLELLTAMGADLMEPNRDVRDFRHADALIHSSVCNHAKILLEECLAGDAAGTDLLLTNCCDSVRRVYDTVKEDPQLRDRLASMEMLDLPHNAYGHAIDSYTEELIRFRGRYEASSGHTFDRQRFLESWKKQADEWEVFSERGDFIAIMGARVSNELRARIRDIMPLPVIDLTCGGLRSMPQPPAEAFKRSCDGCEGDPSADRSGETWLMDDRALMRAYAEALLNQIPCTRMEDVSPRNELLRRKSLKGVVYHSVKFCDYYSYEYADIRRLTELPVRKIETDYTSQSEGQLDTRMKAFAESLCPSGKTLPDSDGTISRASNSADSAEDIFVGIDSGSTSTNVAAISRDGRLLASSIVRTGARAGSAAERAYEDVRQQLGRNAARIRSVTATGYGREFITFADSTKTEISCHAKGAHYADPDARCVIDIGGQDSKVICLDEDGNVMNFVMNDKCAAGTGRFLEMMAHTLETDLSSMSRLGLTWKKDLTISSTCTVFAESEVVSLIAENTAPSDIVHALNKSVAGRTCGMVKRVRGSGPYMMTGGVARNKGVAQEISSRLGEPLSIAEYPDLIGAIGAALFGAQN